MVLIKSDYEVYLKMSTAIIVYCQNIRKVLLFIFKYKLAWPCIKIALNLHLKVEQEIILIRLSKAVTEINQRY